ncbi:PfkB family carbohydrate kinase [Nocardia beijingensis]|uniref:PfkB family carbohydrate kinase n=1 Tax=Nocardia beijingensis TaxID=95162 RepID=UPI0033A0D52C
MRSAAAGYEKLLILTTVDDSAHAEAFTVARSLLAGTAAAWGVVTAGAFGAVAVSGTEEIVVPAFPVNVRHTHCSGAAFSGGLLYGLREGWSMARSMVLGSTRGALRCARHHSDPLPTLAELETLAYRRGASWPHPRLYGTFRIGSGSGRRCRGGLVLRHPILRRCSSRSNRSAPGSECASSCCWYSRREA